MSNPRDVADVAADWFDAVTGVVQHWFEYRDDKVPAEKLIEAIDQLILMHPAYKQARALDTARPTTKQ
jgi:hypothetical protein